jgi:hypothetical protein
VVPVEGRNGGGRVSFSFLPLPLPLVLRVDVEPLRRWLVRLVPALGWTDLRARRPDLVAGRPDLVVAAKLASSLSSWILSGSLEAAWGCLGRLFGGSGVLLLDLARSGGDRGGWSSAVFGRAPVWHHRQLWPWAPGTAPEVAGGCRLGLGCRCVRAETAVVRQFVGDVVVAWPALAWLGVLQQRHGGAAWRRPSVGMPAVPWRCSWRCQAEVMAPVELTGGGGAVGPAQDSVSVRRLLETLRGVVDTGPARQGVGTLVG